MVTQFEEKLINGMMKNWLYSWNMHNVFLNNWKDLAVMVFLKVMPPVLHCWYMFLPGSNVIIRMFLHVLY